MATPWVAADSSPSWEYVSPLDTAGRGQVCTSSGVWPKGEQGRGRPEAMRSRAAARGLRGEQAKGGRESSTLEAVGWARQRSPVWTGVWAWLQGWVGLGQGVCSL